MRLLKGPQVAVGQTWMRWRHLCSPQTWDSTRAGAGRGAEVEGEAGPAEQGPQYPEPVADAPPTGPPGAPESRDSHITALSWTAGHREAPRTFSRPRLLCPLGRLGPADQLLLPLTPSRGSSRKARLAETPGGDGRAAPRLPVTRQAGSVLGAVCPARHCFCPVGACPRPSGSLPCRPPALASQTGRGPGAGVTLHLAVLASSPQSHRRGRSRPRDPPQLCVASTGLQCKGHQVPPSSPALAKLFGPL
ncbi:uncharacterized protein LOC121493486 [Vulpes lagopus]|uniref:uncharacterized protein LOC121493486 n=1 Tax=Vulpes lagopus TaxID=494514 RepID=UPI001BC9054F|nr:uncharacterized protein LOC121493486 [Vulpes lagopus]